MEDDKSNFTRFFLIRKLAVRSAVLSAGGRKKASRSDYRGVIPRGANKTSIVFKVKNASGRAVQIAERVCPAGYQLEQDRVAAHARTSVGVRLLRRLSARRR